MSLTAPTLPDPSPPRSTPPRAAIAYSEAFWQALATLPTHGIAPEQAGAALALWFQLAQRKPPQPDISIDEGVKFSWFGPRYYLEVEVMEDGRVTWYFRETSLPAGQSEGDVEEPVGCLPERFWECLALVGPPL